MPGDYHRGPALRTAWMKSQATSENGDAMKTFVRRAFIRYSAQIIGTGVTDFHLGQRSLPDSPEVIAVS